VVTKDARAKYYIFDSIPNEDEIKDD